MALYLLTLPCNVPARMAGARRMVVEATSAARAREIAELQYDSDVWADSVATLYAAPASFEGWTFRVKVSGPAGAADVHDVSYVGAAAATMDTVGAALAAALVARGLTSAYDLDTRVLTVAAVADALGDRKVRVEVTPPNGVACPVDLTAGAFVEAVVDGGVAAADLTVTFAGATDYEGTTVNIRLSGGITATALGLAGDRLDDLMDTLVTALNGTAINGAAYNAATRVLTVSDAADGLGVQTVEIDFYPAAPAAQIDRSHALVSAITDGGLAADPITITLKDEAVIPGIVAVID